MTTELLPRRRGVILFAHGARDPKWAEPFERLRGLVAAQSGQVDVRLAFLEMMKPDLDEAADALVSGGCDSLSIVPIFLGRGSHLRRDLPERVAALRVRHGTLPIDVAEAAGEDDDVLSAIAAYCLKVSGAGSTLTERRAIYTAPHRCIYRYGIRGRVFRTGLNISSCAVRLRRRTRIS